jgi:hypothetical protein
MCSSYSLVSFANVTKLAFKSGLSWLLNMANFGYLNLA